MRHRICGSRGYQQKNAGSRANSIIEEANREADVIKEKKILQAKEEEMKILGDAERAAGQRMQKAQAAEARNKQREIQLNQQQNENSRRKKNSTLSKETSTTARLFSNPASRRWTICTAASRMNSNASQAFRPMKRKRNLSNRSKMKPKPQPQDISTT